MPVRRKIAIVGAGISGLSSALTISERLPNVDITIIAERFLTDTTSSGAFGLWEPYYLGNTSLDNIKKWGGATLKRMQDLAQSSEGSLAGTYTCHGYSIYRSKQKDDPIWASMVLHFRRMSKEELMQFGMQYVDGFAWRSAATEGKLYLPWLTKKLQGRSVSFTQRKIGCLDKLAGMYDVVVNCTGLGSYQLLNDKDLIPVQGQVIRVKAPWIREFVISDDEDIYILPGVDTVVLGGTHVVGEWDTKVNRDIKERILRKCTQLLPSLEQAAWISDWVGLRPMRSAVRLEYEEIRTGKNEKIKVVHNYGHGGGGVTLHWGCALDTAALVEKALTISKL